MAKSSEGRGFLVRFMDVGARRLGWEERIARPVTEAKIVEAVQRKNALASRGIETGGSSDYGGTILAGGREVGRYLIVPGSERPERHVTGVQVIEESVRRGGSTRNAVCICGWRGPDRGTMTLAADDAETHEADFRK